MNSAISIQMEQPLGQNTYLQPPPYDQIVGTLSNPPPYERWASSCPLQLRIYQSCTPSHDLPPRYCHPAEQVLPSTISIDDPRSLPHEYPHPPCQPHQYPDPTLVLSLCTSEFGMRHLADDRHGVKVTRRRHSIDPQQRNTKDSATLDRVQSQIRSVAQFYCCCILISIVALILFCE